MSSRVLVNVYKLALQGKRLHLLVALANFLGINTPRMVDFETPKQSHLTRAWEEPCIISSASSTVWPGPGSGQGQQQCAEQVVLELESRKMVFSEWIQTWGKKASSSVSGKG